MSRLGEEQSVALGRWFSAMAVDERPNVVLISPYRRAKQTAELIGSVGGIAAHQAVVLCMRYLLEHMTEEQILKIDVEGDVANCAVTEYRFDATQGQHGALVLHRYNFVAPLEQAGAPVTAKPDAAVAAR